MEKNFSTCILLISAVFERAISTKPVTLGVFPVNLNIPESSVSLSFFRLIVPQALEQIKK